MAKTPPPRLSRYFGAKTSHSRSPVNASISAPSSNMVLRRSARYSETFCQLFISRSPPRDRLTSARLLPQSRQDEHGFLSPFRGMLSVKSAVESTGAESLCFLASVPILDRTTGHASSNPSLDRCRTFAGLSPRGDVHRLPVVRLLSALSHAHVHAVHLFARAGRPRHRRRGGLRRGRPATLARRDHRPCGRSARGGCL